MNRAILNRLSAVCRFRLKPWQMSVIGWAVLAVSLFIAARYYKHPLFYSWRSLEMPVLLLVAFGGAWLARRVSCSASGRWRRLEAGLYFVCSLLLMGLVAGQEGVFRWQQYQVWQASAAVKLIGEHFVVGFRDFDEVKPLAERGLIGGIYITRRNLRGETVQSLRAHIDELQMLRQRAGLPPLFVMADQEGGKVAHLSPLIERMPALATLPGEGRENLEARARDYGERQGRALAALGINMNLSPVVDLKIAKQGNWLNLHTQIESRAIDADPEIVTMVAAAYGAGLLDSGVLPTVKHFPGLGRVKGDTHLVKVDLEVGAPERAADWQPFREVTARTGAAMMLGHVRLPDIDPEKPASLSRTLVQNVLRKKGGEGWNYQGVLITDDLNMGAVYDEGIGEAAISALDAGVDLILISYDPDQYYRAIYAVAEAWRSGAMNAERESGSAARLGRYWVRESGIRNQGSEKQRGAPSPLCTSDT
ncbi:MAG: hypothetical protein LBU45_00610 [Azoarcus sp.]|nr:hypothetical protein [Azoarcus sp.]